MGDVKIHPISGLSSALPVSLVNFKPILLLEDRLILFHFV
jgi:hypothetical protein